MGRNSAGRVDEIVGADPTRIVEAANKQDWPTGPPPVLFGDVAAASRIVMRLAEGLSVCINGRVMESSARKAEEHSKSAQREPEVFIRPSRGWVSLNLRELWHYRELIYFLAWRDIIVRYKQTALGVTWAIINHSSRWLFLVCSLVSAEIPSEGVPYPVFTFTALVPWTFFANGLTQASNSLVGSANLIKKVYFPRLAVPISVVVAGLPDLALSFLVLVGMIYYYGITPHRLTALWLPAFVLMAVMTSLGVGLWLAALNVQYRDVRYVIGFLTQLWLFATPVAYYPARLVPEKWQTLYGINPMVEVIEGFRWAVLGTNNSSLHFYRRFCRNVVANSISGLYYFRRMERTFADLA